MLAWSCSRCVSHDHVSRGFYHSSSVVADVLMTQCNRFDCIQDLMSVDWERAVLTRTDILECRFAVGLYGVLVPVIQ